LGFGLNISWILWREKTPDLGWMWIVLYILFSTGWFESMNIFSSDGILGMIFSNLEI
jgi:hypothetical protein